MPRTITEGDVALYIALTGDRNPRNCSAEFARSLGFERETVHDLLVFHIVFGSAVGDISLNAPGNLGYADVRFVRPVYPGDTLRADDRDARLARDVEGRHRRRLGAHHRLQPARRGGAALLPLGDGQQARARHADRRRRRARDARRRRRSTHVAFPTIDLIRRRRDRRQRRWWEDYAPASASPPAGHDDRGGRAPDGDAPLPEHGARALQPAPAEPVALRPAPHLRRPHHLRRPRALVQRPRERRRRWRRGTAAAHQPDVRRRHALRVDRRHRAHRPRSPRHRRAAPAPRRRQERRSVSRGRRRSRSRATTAASATTPTSCSTSTTSPSSPNAP